MAAMAAMAAAPAWVAFLSGAPASATEVDWLTPADGNWTDPTRWSTKPNYPNNGHPTTADTYDAVITASNGSTYYVTLDATKAPGKVVTVDSLTLNNPGGTLFITDGAFQALHGITVNGGRFYLLGGTLLNPTIGGTAGINNVVFQGGAISNLTLLCDANESQSVTFTNGVHLQNANLLLSGGVFDGTQAIDGTGTVNGGNIVSQNGTLTIGPNVTVDGASLSNNAGMVNQGKILTSVGSVNSTTANHPFVNEGSIDVGAGARLEINGPFDNTAGVLRNAGTVIIGRSYQGALTIPTSGLVNLQASGSGRYYVGNLDNTNSTFSATAATGSMTINGPVAGGQLATSGGAEFDLDQGSLVAGVLLSGQYGIRPALGNGNAIGTLQGSTLNDATISLYGSSTAGVAKLQVADGALTGTGTVVFAAAGGTPLSTGNILQANSTLTLAPGITVQTAGGDGTVGALVNQGTLSAASKNTLTASNVQGNSGQLQASAGGILNVTFTPTGTAPVPNSGTVSAATGGTVNLAGNWVNTGSVQAIGGAITLGGTWDNSNGTISATAGGTLNLAFAPTSPAGLGTFSVTDSTLHPVGTYTTAQLAGVSLQRSTVLLTASGGAINNTGANFPLSGGNTLLLQGGRFSGGTITGTGSDQVLVPAGATGTLDNVILAAPLNVRDGGSLTASTGLTLNNATVTLSNNSADPSAVTHLRVENTLGGTGQVLLDGSNSRIQIDSVGATSTLGSGVTVRTSTAGGTLGFTLNQGTISSQSPGQSITLSAPSFTNQGLLEAKNGGSLVLPPSITNAGTISVTDPSALTLNGGWTNAAGTINLTNATLNLAGNFGTNDLGKISRAGGTVNLTGSLNNNAHTLLLGDASGSWNLSGGSITGGTVRTAGGAQLVIPSGTTGSLSGVTLDAGLSLPNSTLSISNGLTLNRNQLAGNALVLLAGTRDDNFIRQASGTLTIAPGITIQNVAHSGAVGNAVGSLVNQGTIASVVAGKSIYIDGAFTNQGTLTALNGGTFTYRQPADSAGVSPGASPGIAAPAAVPAAALPASVFTNSGLVTLGPGSSFTAPSITESRSASLDILIGGDRGPGDYGRLLADGKIDLGGALNLSFAAGFSPRPGDTFEIVSAGSVTGQFDSVSSPLPASDLVTTYGPSGVSVQYLPEPSTLGPLALAGLTLLARRRRRRVQ